MKGIIIAGGRGSRLYPITKVTNKHLLAVYDQPLIYYPLKTLSNAGVKDIAVVSDNKYIEQFKTLLTSNGAFKDINFNFIDQKEAGGIAQALGLCQEFGANEPVAVILGDNIIEENVSSAIQDFFLNPNGAVVFLKSVANPERYEIASISNDKITQIEQKPISAQSNYAVTGLYLYDSQVWQIISGLKPSVRGELEITDVNLYYLKKNFLQYQILDKHWFDIDTFKILLEANIYIAKEKEVEI